MNKLKEDGISIPHNIELRLEKIYRSSSDDLLNFIEIVEFVVLIKNKKIIGILLNESIMVDLCLQLKKDAEFLHENGGQVDRNMKKNDARMVMFG